MPITTAEYTKSSSQLEGKMLVSSKTVQFHFWKNI